MKEVGYELKKIMFYINAIHLGGAERVVVNLANKFVENNYEVVLVTSIYDSWEYPVDKRVKRLSLEKEDLKQSLLIKNVSRVYKLRKICKNEKPDLLISFMAEPNFRALLATKGTKIKNLISVRNDPNKEYRNRSFRIAAKLLYPSAEGCVFQTNEAQNWFSSKIQSKSRVIMNQVDEQFYKTKRIGIGNNIISCGRLVKQKNYKLLIEAFSIIAADFLDENLLIFGEGCLKEELEELIQKKKLVSRIKLMGTSQNIPQVLSEAKIFVLSSDYEGMPNALLEAMAVGVPSISTECPCGGPKMIIKNRDNGILVKANNTEELANAMRELLENEDFLKKIGQNAKKETEKYTVENVFKDWQNYVEDIINI